MDSANEGFVNDGGRKDTNTPLLSNRDAALTSTKPKFSRRLQSSLWSARNSFAIPSNPEEVAYVKDTWGEETWQYKSLRFMNSSNVQIFLIALLLTDVFILFTELALDAFYPSCSIIEEDAISCCPHIIEEPEGLSPTSSILRLLIEGSGGSHDDICEEPFVETDHPAGCDSHKHHSVHVAHDVLFWLTITILVTFELELFFFIYLLGVKFFQVPLYVVDLVIVTVSLALELTLHLFDEEVYEILPGILILFRCWKFVRIGHGLVVSTYEVQEHEQLQIVFAAVEHFKQLENMLREKGVTDLPEWPEVVKEEFQEAKAYHDVH